ncbi:Oxygen-insensitive NADPH nitroreductase [Pediococcus damnosus]|uniref:Oxygen-insensitive NADPH nitroreductase n=1 Tax=Pediococcus damnosus TaxID=51663 RepID=A0A0R2HRN6_9LACO|nr:NADPH-dependent oxidoreductase [Pediococcus damnosus]AMV63461.1 Oxygen-insensitive NADPH nitroreductase [Pediococcus damnosus]AMV66604.1 Oxygen-insensitive NADPH nitroreductase [Pediococcus damnosus]KRN52372.1 nitroreductase [Pediococcus damnosus]PJE49805.1 NADPH-dependent oxidoreductase [Pediococcus damnosus]GEA93832.1 NADPH-dependent oxidoreductase [Pediococcus damnosus]
MQNNETLHLLTHHRSIRHFKNQPVPQDTIQALLNAAQRTSSSMFMQQFSVISVTDPELKKQLAEITTYPFTKSSGHLFIMIADQHRNEFIGQEAKVSTQLLHDGDRSLAAFDDATLAGQSIVTAAESMGLGAVILGSILNDAQQVIDLLHLPKLTFPVFGIAIGYPDEKPDLKPRLPLKTVHFENYYQEPDQKLLDDYDQTIHDYYAQRGSNNRSETYRHHILHDMQVSPKKRFQILAVLKKQGFFEN